MHSSIHWHGIMLPANMDGVPGISFDGIRPRQTYVYRFKVNQHGTYWYHAHSRFQEQTGLYGPHRHRAARRRAAARYDREHVVLLSDWTDVDPERDVLDAEEASDYYNFHKRTVGDFFRDARKQRLAATLEDRRMWGQMRMNPTDLPTSTATPTPI